MKTPTGTLANHPFETPLEPDDDFEDDEDDDDLDDEDDEDDDYDFDEDLADEEHVNGDAEAYAGPDAEALAAVPWAISTALAGLFFSGELAFAGDAGLPEGEPFGALSVRVGRTVIVPVWGVVSSPSIGATHGHFGYEDLLGEVGHATRDRSVHGVVLDFDSAGGAVTGAQEAAAALHQWSKARPVFAYVSGRACGAAYWLASACREIVAADTAVLGDLGVQLAFWDDTEALGRAGVERVQIVSARTPKKNASVATTDGAAPWQQAADDVAAVMLRDVKAKRSHTGRTVNVALGRALVGVRAVRAGLADRCTTRKQMLRALGSRS